MPSVFTKFLDSGSGAVVNDGDTLNYLSSTGVELFEYNVDELATDYFEVSVVAPKKPGEYFFDYGSRSVYLIGRKNTAGTSYCFARIRGDSVRVGAAIDGTSTFASPTWFGSSQAFQWGSYLTFRGGTDAGSRWFQVLSNNRLRATFNDAAAVSLLGSGYRRVGFGLENEDNDLLERAPNISHFNANDNVPVDYPGTGGRMYRTSTGTVNLSSGAFVLPSNFFGNAEQVSDDLTYDLTTGKWTVTNAGRYYVKFSTRTTEGAFPNRMVFALYRNGSAELYGGHTWARFVTGAGTNLTPGWLADEWVIPLAAGDYVQIGYDTTGAASDVLTGTASGLSTYFSITKLS
jgi:hypothetical protein